jgi:carbon storage regulator
MVRIDAFPRRKQSMLIITRKPGEKIMLGDDVTVEVIEVSGSSVRIGIAAPRSLPVYREEIWAQVKEENAAAAKAAPVTEPGTDAGDP